MFKIKTKKEKVDYNAEIDAMKRAEVERCKKECEVYSNRKSYSSNSIMIVFLILLTVVMVGTIIYAVYEIVHISGVSDIAGVHVTPAIRKATNSLVNEGGEADAMKRVPGYENWLIYKDADFMAMYPPDWELKVNGNVIFKKYGDARIRRYDSLVMSMTFGKFDNPDNLAVRQILKENHRKIGSKVVEEEIAGKKALHTGKVILDSGLMVDGIYWALDKEVFYLETVYYDKKMEDLDADCQKLIDSLKFL